jgi:kinesin family protein 3/17
VAHIDTSNRQVNLHKPNSNEPPKSFTFDCVFAPDGPQSEVYEQSAFALVDCAMEGYNGTIFAYGQTGCGKTYTMMGSN